MEHDHTPAIERLDGDTWSIWDDQEGDVTMTTQEAAYQAREALKDWGEL
ncbi:hypothetical protein [Faecalibaculum rodentium]|nr:hypothetical protein [Faecalibaculum rodentium]